MIQKDCARYLMWPIRLKWAPGSSAWFKTHGWQVGDEACQLEQTQRGFMPGFRGVFGWTFHLGRLKICFGKGLPSTHMPPVCK